MAHITIPEEDPTVTYTSVTGTGPLEIPFAFFSNADLVVTVDDVQQTLTVDYTVAGTAGSDRGYPGGTITLVDSVTDATVTIERQIAVERVTDFPSSGPLSISSLNTELDRIWAHEQEQEIGFGRSVRQPTGEALGSMTLPVKASRLNKYIGTDSNGDIVVYSTTGSDSDTVTVSGTPTARSLSERFGEIKNVRDYGAVGDGVTDDTDAIQDALDDLDHNEALYFPPTPNAWYKTSAPLLLSSKSGITYFGAGPLASRIRMVGATINDDVIKRSDTSLLQANNINHITFRDIGIESSGNARHGINWLSMSNSAIQNVWITGSGFVGAGLYITSSIALKISNLEINGPVDGIRHDTGAWTGLNGLEATGLYFNNLSGYGLSDTAGSSNVTIRGVMESCHLGGIRLGQDCHDWDIKVYCEENKTAATNTQDIYIGESAICTNIRVWGQYFNGNTDATDFYYPVRMKYARGCTIDMNGLFTGQKFIAFVTGGSLAANTIHVPTLWTGTYKSPENAQPTLNFGANTLQNFVNAGNRIVDNVNVPVILANPLRKRLPYGGWTLTEAGASDIRRSDVDVGGAYGFRMTRGTGACQASITVTPPKHFLNQICTLAIPIISRASTKQLDIALASDGTGEINGTISDDTITSGTGKIIWVTTFVPSDATTLTPSFGIASNSGDFDLGHPHMYVGCERQYSPQMDQDWEHTAAPTEGTWADGDHVKNSAPAAAGVPGWICTTPGTPGTFKARAAVAA